MSSGLRSGNSTVKQTIVSNLEAPRLKGIATKDFYQFQRLRELYEKQLGEKNREPGVNITATSYRASIDDGDLRIFLTAKWIEADDIASITEDQLRQCIKSRSTREVGGEQLHLVDEAVKQIKMNMSIAEAEDRVWTLHRQYVQALENAGFADLPVSKPHISIGHIIKRVKPQTLRHRMRDIVKWRKDAKRIEDENFTVSALAEGPSSDDSDQESNEERRSAVSKRKQKRLKKSKGNPSRKSGREDRGDMRTDLQEGHESKKRKRDSSDLSPCLNPDCRDRGGRHFINNCPETSEEKAKLLRKEYRDAKRLKADGARVQSSGKVLRFGSRSIKPHSALFTASFAAGAVETIVLADQGSDTNLISTKLLKAIQKSTADIDVKKIQPPHVYNGIGKHSKVVCNAIIKADVLLKVRHASRLLLRNVEWKVGNHGEDHAIIGRPLLDSIGCDNRALLAAACDKYGGVIDVEDSIKEDNSDGNISSLMADAIFHSGGGIEADGLEDEDVYIDIGDDPEEELTRVLDGKVKDAEQAGLSEAGVRKLRDIVHCNKSIFD